MVQFGQIGIFRDLVGAQDGMILAQIEMVYQRWWWLNLLSLDHDWGVVMVVVLLLLVL